MAEMTLDRLMKFFAHVEGKRHNWNNYWQDVKDILREFVLAFPL